MSATELESLPLKWHGGKAAFNGKLAKWIIGLMPPHTHYVEPYFGAGAVLFHKDPEGVSEVINDLHGELMNFWMTLRDEPEALLRRVQATPFSEQVFVESGKLPDSADYVDRAAALFVRCRQSRQGLMEDFATMSRSRVRRGMNEQVSSWLSAIDGMPAVHDRLKRVVMFSRDALKVIREQDGESTLFYLDPPYMHETRETTGNYDHEMNEREHRDLLNVLQQVQGKFLLSGYRTELYDSVSKMAGWERHDFEIVNNASSRKKKSVKTESVWCNFRECSGGE